MDKRIKAKWVEALREGFYKQATGTLHNSTDGSYCCLGVLCDGYIQETGRGEWDDGYLKEGDEYNGGFLPLQVAEWAGLRTNPAVTYEGMSVSLSSLNDDRGKTFAEIADLIEGSDL